MIKITHAEHVRGYEIRLRFTDGSEGTLDFSSFIEAATPMTIPLAAPDYFPRFFIELGALAWPNGFDLSAESLRQRLEAKGLLRGKPAA